MDEYLDGFSDVVAQALGVTVTRESSVHGVEVYVNGPSGVSISTTIALQAESLVELDVAMLRAARFLASEYAKEVVQAGYRDWTSSWQQQP